MPEIICNTSPLQYLHQLELLSILPKLSGKVIVPPAVVGELAAGIKRGMNLPDVSVLEWVVIRRPISTMALSLINDLGPGETEVLMLAIESFDPIVILDDGLARQVAELRGIRLTGTLGLLIDAKKAGLIPAVKPVLDQLDALQFRLALHTRLAVLKLVGESR